MFHFVKRLFYHINSRKDPVGYARKLGVKVGERCSFTSFPDFGSEPYLIELGNHVRTSSDVAFVTHDGATWVFREEEKYKKVIRYGKITVRDNCFLGMRCIILPGVTIGENSIVAAGAVVTKDVPAGSIVAGVPAKVVSKTDDFAEKCLRENPDYDYDLFKKSKKESLLKLFG